MIKTDYFQKVMLGLGMVFLSACGHREHGAMQFNHGQREVSDSSIRDSKDNNGFLNHYATVFVRTQGEKVIYEERGQSISPSITYPGQTPVCFYELKDESYRRFSNVNEVVNFMASRGWRLKSLNNASRGSEDIFWMTFESTTVQGLSTRQERNPMQTVPTTVSFARRERKPSLAERPEAGLRSPEKNSYGNEALFLCLNN